jgi:hypothetical protein
VIIQLETDDILPLRNATGGRITCVSGALWITQDGDPNDIVLESGASHEVTGKGMVLLQAVRPSRFAVEQPGRQAIALAMLQS